MSEYAGRIAVGAIVAVALVVGLAFELNYLVPNNASTTSSGTPTSLSTNSISLTTASTPFTSGWFGNEAPPPGCGNMTIASYVHLRGYTMDMYSSSPGPGWSYPLGGSICFYTYLQNLNNQSSSLPNSENLKVVKDMNQTKVTYFESGCPVPAYSGSFVANSTGWNCEVVWNTSQPYNGILPTAGVSPNTGDVYVAYATVTISNSTSTISTSDAFVFRTTPPTNTTTSSNPAPTFSCGDQRSSFRLLTPLQSGPISLKVVTDQGGLIVNNGTVFITHRATNGTSSNYCLRLQGNATGYVQLSANDGLPQTGTYNVTLFAGYNQGPGYEGAIPSISISTNTVVSVTISVPSGEVHVVTSTQGISLVTTTTTTATSIEGHG